MCIRDRSVGMNQGLPIPNVVTDLIGVLRDGMTPDIGCFELVE